MAKTLSRSKIDKIFKGFTQDLFHKMIENADAISLEFSSKGSTVTPEIYDMICERLLLETAIVYREKKDKHGKSKSSKKQITENAQGTVAN